MMKTTAEVMEQVLQFERLNQRRQNREWLAALEELAGHGAEPFLRLLSESTMMKDDRHIRWAVAVVLGEIGDPAAMEPLCRLLNDFPSVQRAAASALGQIADARGIDPLIDKLSLQESPELVRTAGEVLANIGAARALEPIRTILSEVTSRNWGGAFTPESLARSLRILEAKQSAVTG